MTETVAWTVLVALAAVAVSFWLVTTSWFVRVAREAKEQEGPDPADFHDRHAPDGEWARGALRGRLEVKGQPEALAAALAADLGRHGLVGSPVQILDVDRGRVRFEVKPLIGSGGASSRPRRGEVAFHAAGGGTSRADYRLEAGAGRWLLQVGAAFTVLGLVAIAALFWGLSTYAIPDPRSGVRTQVVQMVQCIHFLWPPWLLGMIYKRTNGAFQEAVTARIANLPYV